MPKQSIGIVSIIKQVFVQYPVQKSAISASLIIIGIIITIITTDNGSNNSDNSNSHR